MKERQKPNNLVRYKLRIKAKRSGSGTATKRNTRYYVAYAQRRFSGLRKYMKVLRDRNFNIGYKSKRGTLRYIHSIAFWNTMRSNTENKWTT